jgi:hypothetical protein
MADQKIELEIVMDDGSIKRAFGSIKKEAQETGNIFGNAFKINSVTDLASAITLADKALTLFKGTADALLNQVLAGEKIDAINKRFEILAQQAGISADALSTGIAVAVDGTVDMEEALQATSSSLINLEVGLNKIPQLFEIARKSAAGFSGDTISNFERIQQAVITGNTKSLKEIGIFINAASAIDNYEIAIGAAKGTLTEANKQQAILNEVLKVGDERFKNISTSITPVDESVKKLKVSYGELGDTVANFSNNILGAIFTERLNSARTSLDAFNIKLGEWLLGKAPTASENIKLLTYQLQELEKSLVMAQVRGDVDRAAQIMAEKEALTQKLAVEKEAVNTQTQKNLADLDGNTLNKDKQIQLMAVTDAMKEQWAVMDAYTKMMQEQAAKTAMISTQLGATVKSALVNAISQSVQAMVKAIMTGGNVLSAMGKTILGVFGDLAIQTGGILIGIGIGLESLKALNGFAAVAAGIGLVAVGSVLKALSSGEGSNAGVTANGGGVAFTGDQTLPADQGLTSFQAAERQAPNTVVNFTVQGDILDSDSTQSRIVALLNDAIDTKGAVVRGLA